MMIHGDKLRWLFWLRWKLFTRSFTRDKAHIISTIFLAVFLLPFIALIAIGTFFAYRFLPAPLNVEILFLVLTGVYVLWIVLPIFEYSVNEGLDISKLILFPLTRPELMLSLLFSTLLDIPMLGLLLVFGAVVAGWAISIPVVILTLAAILIFYAQVIGMSQLVLALLMRTLQSRRFRDLSIIIIVLFSSLCGIVSQFLGRIASFIDFRHGLTFYPSLYLQWLPPGMTARSIQQAALGNWGASLIWLGASLVAAIVVLYLWQVVVERSLSTPESGGRVRVRRHREAGGKFPKLPRYKRSPLQASTTGTYKASPLQVGIFSRILSPQVLAITNKELKYFWRDPQLKAVVFQSLISGAFFVIWPLLSFGTTRTSFITQWLVLLAPLAVFFSMLSLSFNSLGIERQSLTTLFLFPVEPQRILWGKNLAVFLIGTIELLIVVGIGAFVSHAWNFLLPALTVGFAGIAIVLGTGNFSSVFLPQRMREMQRGFRATGAATQGQGCLRAVLSIAMLAVSLVVLSPVALALALPLFFHAQWIWAFSIPGALIYGIAFHQAVSRLVAPRILQRAPEILAITTRE